MATPQTLPANAYGDDPDAYDPVRQPDLFRDIRRRRVVAWLLDVVIIGALTLFFGLVVFLLGLLTLGLGWMLFTILAPTVAVLYVATTVATRQATWGMAMVGLTMRMWYGAAPGFWIGAAHATMFWVFSAILPVLSLLPPLFDRRKRMIHDMVLGTVVLDAEALRQGV